MDQNNLPIHIKLFSDKVKQMNQRYVRDLVLSASEARNLHSDIFDLLNHCARLSLALEKARAINSGSDESAAMDGGSFK